MSLRLGVLTVGGAVTLVSLTGCESTADRSARLAGQAAKAKTERGLRVAEVDRSVRVLDTATITDANGSAVVVTLRASGRTTTSAVPIAIDVRSAGGKTVFRNDTPGAEPGLVSLAVLAPGKAVDWVHDQVQPIGGRPRRALVRVGRSRARVARTPRLTIGAVRLTRDPVSGTEGSGRVTNRSDVIQRRLTIYAVARRGRRVVAAGRGVVNRLAPGRSARFAVFFIGNPAGARISVTAPPTVLR